MYYEENYHKILGIKVLNYVPKKHTAKSKSLKKEENDKTEFQLYLWHILMYDIIKLMS